MLANLSTIYQSSVSSLIRCVSFQSSLVGYGGTGNPNDLTMALFAASVQNVHIESPLSTLAAMVMLYTLLIDILNVGTAELDALNSAITDAMNAYGNTIYDPSYFADTLPQLPVVNYYDSFMGPGALPLQYVKMPVSFIFHPCHESR